jgi:hypothetical protein
MKVSLVEDCWPATKGGIKLDNRNNASTQREDATIRKDEKTMLR